MLTKNVRHSIVRTLTPIIVGWLLTAAARANFDIDEGSLTNVVQAVVTGAYYIAARLLEEHRGAWGWLLGLARPPIYPKEDHRP